MEPIYPKTDDDADPTQYTLRHHAYTPGKGNRPTTQLINQATGECEYELDAIPDMVLQARRYCEHFHELEQLRHGQASHAALYAHAYTTYPEIRGLIQDLEACGLFELSGELVAACDNHLL